MSIHFSSRNASSRRPFVYVVRVQTSRIISINLTVGTRLPAALTAMGRVLLAALQPGDLYRALAASSLRPTRRVLSKRFENPVNSPV
jgi:DNA-binding IclR family transcriptional regulator